MFIRERFMETEQNQSPAAKNELLIPWLRPIERAFVYLGAFVFAAAIVSLSLSSEWHQTYLVLQYISVSFALLAGIILCVRGYNEQRVGNKRLESELIGLGGLYMIFLH